MRSVRGEKDKSELRLSQFSVFRVFGGLKHKAQRKKVKTSPLKLQLCYNHHMRLLTIPQI